MVQMRELTQTNVHSPAGDIGNGIGNGIAADAIQPKQGEDRRTNLSWWRLNDVEGRQTWEYLEDEEIRKRRPQSVAEQWHLGLPTVSRKTKRLSTLCGDSVVSC